MSLRPLPAWLAAKIRVPEAGLIVELYEFGLPSGARYWSKVTGIAGPYNVDGHDYLPYVASRGPVVEEIDGKGDGTRISLINVDGVVRDLILGSEFELAPFRLRLYDPETAVGADNPYTLFVGRSTSPVDASERVAEVKILGLRGALLQISTPGRTTSPVCPWVFGPIAAAVGAPTRCGYAGAAAATSTAYDSGARKLSVDGMQHLLNSVGRTVRVGATAPVRVAGIEDTAASKAIYLADDRAAAPGGGDDVTFVDCRKNFNDCFDARRTHEYGGLRAISLVRTLIPRDFPSGVSGPGLFTKLKDTNQNYEVVPVVYGRRLVTGINIELSTWNSGLAFGYPVTTEDDPIHNVAAFYLLSAGVVAGAPDQWYVGGIRTGNQTIEYSGYRIGVVVTNFRLGEWVGTPDVETELEYSADDWALVRPQNQDFRTDTAGTYNGLAYAIFSASIRHPIWQTSPDFPALDTQNPHPEYFVDTLVPTPEFLANMRGRVVQAYDANGAPVGAAAWNSNPIWGAIDFLLDPYVGGRIDPALIDYAAAYESAPYADEEILIVESMTVALDQEVDFPGYDLFQLRRTIGWQIGDPLYRGVAPGTFADRHVFDVVNSANLELDDASPTTEAGEPWFTKRPRFECHLWIKDNATASNRLDDFLSCCRGYLTTSGGKFAFRIERPAEIETYDPSV